MKRITAGLSLVAAVGFAGLAASPAVAAPIVFDNCTQAASFGVFNIPAGSPGYSTDLDRPVDGVGCESDTVAYNSALVPDDGVVVSTPAPAPTTPAPAGPQVVQMPVGGAATGAAVNTGNDAASLALGGSLVLAVAAGGALMVRRRANQA